MDATLEELQVIDIERHIDYFEEQQERYAEMEDCE